MRWSLQGMRQLGLPLTLNYINLHLNKSPKLSIIYTSLGDFCIMNPDKIHELRFIMNTTKITNQTTMHDTVRNKQFIVGSFQPATGLSFSPTPAVQYTAQQARSECKRLSKMYPGKTFVYVQLQGAEMTVPQPTTVSI